MSEFDEVWWDVLKIGAVFAELGRDPGEVERFVD